jgi:hypothetical protein
LKYQKYISEYVMLEVDLISFENDKFTIDFGNDVMNRYTNIIPYWRYLFDNNAYSDECDCEHTNDTNDKKYINDSKSRLYVDEFYETNKTYKTWEDDENNNWNCINEEINYCVDERKLSKDKVKALYDNQCKVILNNKYILAWILKSVAKEFANIEIEDIASKYIEQDASIDKLIVDYPTGRVITGINSESNHSVDGKRTFDVVFSTRLPEEYSGKKSIVDVEAQNDFYPGYEIVTRGMYYGARLISGQYEKEFFADDYDNIKKVYSIWICTNPPEKYCNSINIYETKEQAVLGNMHIQQEAYDKISVIKICLGGENCKKEIEYKGIVKLLDVLLVSNKSPDEKKIILENEFEIPITKMLESEVEKMCNVSDTIYSRGIEDGIEDGISMLSQLINCLNEDMRMDEILLVANDQEKMKELMKEYGIKQENRQMKRN